MIMSHQFRMGKLSMILKDWDGSNQVQRRALLNQFLDLTKGKTAIDLDDELGHSTFLLFARFISSLRLRYNTKNISPLLDAIHRFTGATGGTWTTCYISIYSKCIQDSNMPKN